jgi:phosphatidylglycerophosphate synthase
MLISDTPRSIPAVLLRDAVVTMTLTALVLLAAAWMLIVALNLSPIFAGKVMLLYVAAAIWLGCYMPAHRPHIRLGPANRVTLARLALTALLGGMIGEAPAAVSLAAPVIAGLVLLLDGVDGWLARRGGWTSAFGARFDMETDALAILLMTVLAWQLEKAGAWVLLSGALRYLFIAATVALPRLARPLRDSRRRKVVCVVQALVLLLVLTPWVSTPWSDAIAATGLAMLIYSFTVDTVWLWRQRMPLTEENLSDENDDLHR